MSPPLETLAQALTNGDKARVIDALTQEPSTRSDGIDTAHHVILPFLVGHAMCDSSAFSGVRLADFVNGIFSAFFDEPDRRPRHMAASAKLCRGQVAYFVDYDRRSTIRDAKEDIDALLLESAQAHDWPRCEDCLLAIWDRDGAKAVLERIWLLLTEPPLLGHYRYEFAGYLAELNELFTDPASQRLCRALTCRMGAQYAARHPECLSGEEHERPRDFLLDENLVHHLQQQFDELAKHSVIRTNADKYRHFNSKAFQDILDRADAVEVFDAIGQYLTDGHSVRRLYESLMVHSLGRLIRGPIEAPTEAHQGWRWNPLKRQFTAVAEIPKCMRCASPQIAARVLFHAAFLLVAYRTTDLGESPNLTLPEKAVDESDDELLDRIESTVRSANVETVTRLVLSYLSAELPPHDLLFRLRQATGDSSCGQRMLVDTWFELKDSSDRHLVLLAMARWGTYAHCDGP